jgi:ubiquinone/menaquinone biosynthesis C-methylase UbiE
MYDELIEITGIPQDGTILEIGSGTGQATLPLAKRGYTITCLEPGLNLMQIAKKKLTKYPKVNFLNATFEEWPIEKDKYDLVTSATAFHWVDQKVGYKKANLSLKPKGNLALFWNKHPKPYTRFFEEVQQIYQKIVPEWPDPNKTQSDEDWIKETQTNIVASGLFNIT